MQKYPFYPASENTVGDTSSISSTWLHPRLTEVQSALSLALQGLTLVGQFGKHGLRTHLKHCPTKRYVGEFLEEILESNPDPSGKHTLPWAQALSVSNI